MNSGMACERARRQLMAALDGEAVPGDTDASQHLSSCSSCERWLRDLESMNRRFQDLSYPPPPADLWASVEARLRQPDTALALPQRLWIIGACVLGWRALQLLIDLPFPMLHPLVSIAGAVAALWLIARDPLAIETSAPELQKGGV